MESEGGVLEGAARVERLVWEGWGRARDRSRDTLGGDEGSRAVSWVGGGRGRMGVRRQGSVRAKQKTR